MEHITTIDAAGLAFIKSHEGFREYPYLDTAQVPTIGYGQTRYADGTRVKMTDEPITEPDAEKLLTLQLKFYESEVDAMTRDDISQGMFNALVSFAYNEGAKKLQGSHLLAFINANPADKANITHEWQKWIYSGGKVTPGLVARRAGECIMAFEA